MARSRRTDISGVPRPRGRTTAFLRRWTVPVVGGITPVLLLAINVAAFLVAHLSDLRWAITVLAFISGMMLNSYMALNFYRVVQRRFPDQALFHPSNEELVVVLGMGFITGLSFLLAFLCYSGLKDPNQLGLSGFTFFYGLIQIVAPAGYKLLFDRDRERHGTRTSSGGHDDRVRRLGASGSTGSTATAPSGYTPPTSLPPS